MLGPDMLSALVLRTHCSPNPAAHAACRNAWANLPYVLPAPNTAGILRILTEQV